MTDFNIIAAAVRLTAPANARYTPKIAKLRTRSATIASDSWIGTPYRTKAKTKYRADQIGCEHGEHIEGPPAADGHRYCSV